VCPREEPDERRIDQPTDRSLDGGRGST
jgi:hypothetical protein